MQSNASLDLDHGFGGLFSIVVAIGGFFSFFVFCMDIWKRQSQLLVTSGKLALQTILMFGVITWIAYGFIWVLINRLVGRNYGAGASGIPLTGWATFALSLSVTIPLSLVPLMKPEMVGVSVIPKTYWKAALALVMGGVIAHLLIYGLAGWGGLHGQVVPAGNPFPTWGQAIEMEFVYAATFFCLMVIPFRLIVAPSHPILWWDLARRVLLPGMTCAVCTGTYITYLYPMSLRDPIWIQTRGIISAGVLMTTLCGGLFL